MKTFLIFIVVIFFLSGCDQIIPVVGNGNIIKQDRAASGFTKVEVSGSFQVLLIQGETESLTIETDENLFEHINSVVKNGELTISTRKNLHSAKPVKIIISFKNLDEIELSGAIKLTGKDTLRFDKFEIDGSGSSKINMDLYCRTMIAEFSGSSEMELRGESLQSDFKISGSGVINTLEFGTDIINVDISGSGRAQVKANKKLNVQISGSGRIEYTGNPQIKQEISGSGSVNHIEVP